MTATAHTLTCRMCKAQIALPAKGAPTPRLLAAWNNIGAAFACKTCRGDYRFRYVATDLAWLHDLEDALAYQAAREALLADLPAALADRGVPAHWRGASFASCRDVPADLIAAARRWAAVPTGMLYLFGAPGSGKTTLAVAILREILERDTVPSQGCRFASERAYLGSVKAAFDGGTSARSMPETTCALLVLDDLAASRLTDWGRAEIAGLIESRHGAELPTIITSNVASNDLGAAVDGRVASRLGESKLLWGFPSRDLRLTGSGNGH